MEKLRKNSCNWLLVCVCILCVCSCKKDKLSEVQDTQYATYTTLDEFYQKQGVEPVYVTFADTTTQTVFNIGNARITIPQNAFYTASNLPVTGNVTVEWKELKSIKDRILSNAANFADTTLLLSENTVCVNFTSSAGKVKMAPGKLVTVKLKTDTSVSSSFKLYSGIANNGSLYWESTPSVSVSGGGDTLMGLYYQLILDTPQVNAWYTIAKKYTASVSYLSLSAVNISGPDVISTDAFLVIKSINQVYRLTNFGNGTYVPISIPNGMDAYVIGIGLDDKKRLYYGEIPLNITNNQSFNLEMSISTDEKIRDQLNKF